MKQQSNFDIKHLNTALANDEFIFFYQPIISLVSGKIKSCEALLRWKKADGSLVLPGEFLPIALETGFITDIMIHMLTRLKNDLVEITKANADIRVAINLSIKDISSPKFIEQFNWIIKDQGIKARNLQIELTERSSLRLNKKARNFLIDMVSQDMIVAIDDFGTGHSTIERLSRFPIASLKIDKGIIYRSQVLPDSLTILDHLVNMAHQLQLDSIAEGVENEGMYDYLVHLGCTHFQGYLHSKPMPIKILLESLQSEIGSWEPHPIGEIFKAQIDHIDMTRRIVSVVTSKLPISDMSKLDHTQCRLGKWYYSDGQTFKGTSSFDLLESHHRKFHELAKMLVNAKLSGNSWTSILQITTDLLNESTYVLKYLKKMYKEQILEQVGMRLAG